MTRKKNSIKLREWSDNALLIICTLFLLCHFIHCYYENIDDHYLKKISITSTTANPYLMFYRTSSMNTDYMKTPFLAVNLDKNVINFETHWTSWHLNRNHRVLTMKSYISFWLAAVKVETPNSQLLILLLVKLQAS